MTISAIVHIFENIDEKKKSFKKGVPILHQTLLDYTKTGINDNGQQLAKVNYVQNATGECDFIMQIESSNIKNLMAAINKIRTIDQVKETKTNVGEQLFP